MVGTLTFRLHLPTCASLREKRGRIRPLIARLHREFNVSVAEMELLDQWQEALIGCVMISNEPRHLEGALRRVANWVQANWPDGMIVEDKIELI